MSKTVLITRPEGQHSSLMETLTENGWHCVHQPLMRIQPISGDPSIKDCILNLDHFQHVISVSANASQIAVDWIDQYWPQTPVDIHWYAVGGSSAKPLTALDVEPKVPTLNQTEGLLSLPELQSIEQDKILILRGQGGRETLAESLTERGASVRYAELYRRELIHSQVGFLDTLIETQQIHYVVLTSGELVNHFIDQLQQADKILNDVQLIVPSDRVAKMALDAGAKHVNVSQGASPEAILAALEK